MNVGDNGFLVLTDRYYRRPLFWTFYHPTCDVLPPLLQVFLEAESVVVAELFPEVVVWVAEPEAFALVFVVAELSPEVVVLAAEPEVFALVFVVAEP